MDTQIATKMIEQFVSNYQTDDHGVHHIDCARIYAGGDSEKILREAMSSVTSSALSIGTKAHPSQPGGLSEQGLLQQLEKSFDALGVASVDEYYLHQPDENTSLLESLQTTDKLGRLYIYNQLRFVFTTHSS